MTPEFSSAPVRLGDLAREGKLLWGYCRACGRERDIDPAAIPVPAAVPVFEIGQRMRSIACGSGRIDTRPELYPGGIGAWRERWSRARD